MATGEHKREEGAAGENGDAGTVWCIECEDVAASVRCEACGGDYFCGLCFQWQHRSGRRLQHKPTALPGKEMFRETAEGTTQHFIKMQQQGKGSATADSAASKSAGNTSASATKEEAGAEGGETRKNPTGQLRSNLVALSQFIPVRISAEERVYLRLLEGALEVSEYTDKVDVVRGWSFRNSKHDTIREEIGDMLQLLLGLVVAGNYKQGTALVAGADMHANAAFFQKVLEIGRRFKITNPEKMRCSYGKLIYLMQDAPSAMDFSVKADIRTVFSVLTEKKGIALLEDEDTAQAIEAVSNVAGYGEEAPSRASIEARAAAKQLAIKRLCEKHASKTLSKEDVESTLASLSDFNSFVDSNRRPVDDMLTLLKTHFHPGDVEGKFSLEISQGLRGSKLSHSHGTQYTFVLQTLCLWQKVTENMFRLWILAERDLLSDSQYRLANTGQGMNRVQNAPKISHAMHTILSKVQQSAGSWVGLSVVHLGDRDVPNALVFIDKYTQVARLLKPIVDCIAALPLLGTDPKTAHIISKYGGAERLQKFILADFFKHGFDGSGSDGGSCIDGRLTSAWNWCSKLEKKSYYPIFMLAGFQGFDGDFRS